MRRSRAPAHTLSPITAGCGRASRDRGRGIRGLPVCTGSRGHSRLRVGVASSPATLGSRQAAASSRWTRGCACGGTTGPSDPASFPHRKGGVRRSRVSMAAQVVSLSAHRKRRLTPKAAATFPGGRSMSPPWTTYRARSRTSWRSAAARLRQAASSRRPPRGQESGSRTRSLSPVRCRHAGRCMPVPTASAKAVQASPSLPAGTAMEPKGSVALSMSQQMAPAATVRSRNSQREPVA